MNKAFIFDMDGVLVDSERAWVKHERVLLDDLLGAEIAQKLPDTTGLNLSGIYDKAVSLGFRKPKEEFLAMFDTYAVQVYKEAVLTAGADKLISELQNDGFRVGIVSSSPSHWIEMVMERTSYKDMIAHIISLEGHADLRAKPHPDGYLAMMEHFGSSPESTVILEDSNYGIQAAKKAGAYVIGYRGNLHAGYEQRGADAYADTMEDVMKIVKKHEGRSGI